jgi:hypothetical protein
MENTQPNGYETQVWGYNKLYTHFFLQENYGKFQVFRVCVVQISVLWVLTLIIK